MINNYTKDIKVTFLFKKMYYGSANNYNNNSPYWGA